MPPERASKPTLVGPVPELKTPAPAPEGTRTTARSSMRKLLVACMVAWMTIVCVATEMLVPSEAVQRITWVPGPICARPPTTVIGVVSATPLLTST